MPLNTSSLNALPKELGTHGSAVNNTVRQLAGAIGTAVIVTIYTAQATSHAETVVVENPSATADMISSLASMLGSGDAYYFMTILGVMALVLTLVLPKKQPKAV